MPIKLEVVLGSHVQYKTAAAGVVQFPLKKYSRLVVFDKKMEDDLYFTQQIKYLIFSKRKIFVSMERMEDTFLFPFVKYLQNKEKPMWLAETTWHTEGKQAGGTLKRKYKQTNKTTTCVLKKKKKNFPLVNVHHQRQHSDL